MAEIWTKWGASDDSAVHFCLDVSFQPIYIYREADIQLNHWEWLGFASDLVGMISQRVCWSATALPWGYSNVRDFKTKKDVPHETKYVCTTRSKHLFMTLFCNRILQHTSNWFHWEWKIVAKRIIFTTRFQSLPWPTDSSSVKLGGHRFRGIKETVILEKPFLEPVGMVWSNYARETEWGFYHSRYPRDVLGVFSISDRRQAHTSDTTGERFHTSPWRHVQLRVLRLHESWSRIDGRATRHDW